MGRAKDIIVKVIPAKIANEFVKKHHYSGKSVMTSRIHFGCFLDNKLHGAVSLGNPFVKKNVIGLVDGAKWNEMLEINRIAFDDYLPKNSESRCISIIIKLLKKNASHIKWILSFADSCQCGDGSIYRASGFYLTKIKQNDELIKYNNKVYTRMSFGGVNTPKSLNINRSQSHTKNIKEIGGIKLDGFQLRYIYLIDKSCKITVPILPFLAIDKAGAGMYKGKKVTLAERQQQAQLHHVGDGAAIQPLGAFDSTAALNI
jgi:hypothetical protein